METRRDYSDREIEQLENEEWKDSLDYVISANDHQRVEGLLRQLHEQAYDAGISVPVVLNTPYINTIPVADQPAYPGDQKLEKRIENILRWNAAIMVVRGNRNFPGIGGHISTYASSATLYEMGFNHFFRSPTANHPGDLVYIQAHASPGIYSRAFLEGRLTQQQLENFRRELQPGGGLSSYTHPRLLPEFWQFPTASMGLSPLMAIYQAQFAHYLNDRGLKERGGKIWTFVGDGEMDEVESLGAINFAASEQLDNLIFVINCNLQRLDGPVRGNSKVIQELERIFRGAGWNVIKVLWGSGWDALLQRDQNGLIRRRMDELKDGHYQKYSVESGKFNREHFFSINPELMALSESLTDEEIRTVLRGGHDPIKLYAAYHHAVSHRGSPTVILAKTVKGYGIEPLAGKNATHQLKKLETQQLMDLRDQLEIPIPDSAMDSCPYYRPDENSPEIQYLLEHRRSLGGFIPSRQQISMPLPTPPKDLFAEFKQGSDGRQISTTMVFVRILSKLLKNKELGKYIVPIIADEARTLGMESLFPQVGIYSRVGQLYDPVDAGSVTYYREAKDGQILQEGINEGGSVSSFIAAGTAYANYGIPTIPVYAFYSMFGMQRSGDLFWAASDAMSRGFLIGGTSGKTTLNGEGFQHQDGHSHVMASVISPLHTYDPAFAYELAVIIREGIRRMYEKEENVFYYITVANENYAMPPMPKGCETGILKGAYCFKRTRTSAKNGKACLLASGTIINEALAAQKLLSQYKVAAEVWSVTSYNELRRDALECERWNLLHPGEPERIPYVSQIFQDQDRVYVAVSDFMKTLPDSIAKWMPGPLISLGTDGYGRSETREVLREHFEVNAAFITLSALSALARQEKISLDMVQQAQQDLQIDPNKTNPMII